MAGKMTDGTDNTGAFRLAKAYAEGAEARFASTTPVNPHPVGSADSIAFALGSSQAAGGTVDKCVAGWGRTAPV